MIIFIVTISSQLIATVFGQNIGLIDQMAAHGQSILSQSAISGATIRQCSCREQSICVKEMKAQGIACVDRCWSRFEQVVDDPIK
jgi:hypothetical protein